MEIAEESILSCLTFIFQGNCGGELNVVTCLPEFVA
jgi:hypothetical protein